MNRAKAEFFDSQVEEAWATSAFGPDEMGKIDRMLRPAGLGKGMRVIEPGCGTGRLTVILADIVGPQGQVLGLDISSKMIESARRRIGSRDNVLLEWASVEGYSFDAESFDVVICHNIFPHFDDKPRAVADLAAALKKGGRFIIFHFMNSAGINDLHRKAHFSVLNDMIPSRSEIELMFKHAGLSLNYYTDDDDGYLLSAAKTRL
jgi:demethylmenaquinone methyltransferase/2-methoxy-6-polyprenyl-1,4-benzoquinol methylase